MMASIIPPRKPKKQGMPKITIPPRPDSSSSASRPFGDGTASQGQNQPVTTNPAQAGPSNPARQRPTLITSSSARSIREGRSEAPPLQLVMPSASSSSVYGYPAQEDESAYEGHLPYQSTASSIYPDTVPAGPLTDHQAWTNDLKRAIGDGGSGSGGRRTSAGELGSTRRHAEGANGDRRTPSFSGSTDELSSSKEQMTRSTSAGSHRHSYQRDGDGQAGLPLRPASDAVDGQEEAEEEDWVLKGNIETIARLGEGASGEVRKARHAPTGLVMAVKTIPTSPNPSVHRQILRELSFNRTCYSPYIVKYYGAFLSSDAQSIEICMEYCEAGSLDVIYKRVKSRNGRTGEKILGRVAESVLKGLHYLHDRHIIHRDIKPSNIVITREGQIKLCDFGVSGELINSLAGTFTGTSYYMAPERIKGLPYTITSDVWSLGLTILEIASNRFPFPAEGEPPLGPVDLLSYIVSMPTPELNDDPVAGIKWSRGLRDFIDRCLDKNGETRLGPKKMLTHPFIKKSEARIPPADVGKFVAEVYGWPVATSACSEAPPSKAISSAPTPPQSAIAGSAAAPSAEEVLRLSRIPSVRKAPLNPLAAMSLSSSTTPVEAVPKMPHLPNAAGAAAIADHQAQSRTPTAPGMPPVERLDLEGSSTSERLAAKMRELDAGTCGSPLDPELTRR